jgi:hypothetical protein
MQPWIDITPGLKFSATGKMFKTIRYYPGGIWNSCIIISYSDNRSAVNVYSWYK